MKRKPRPLPKPQFPGSLTHKRVMMIASYIGLCYAAFGWFNAVYLKGTVLFIDSVWVSSWSQLFIVIAFGPWRIAMAENRSDLIRVMLVYLGSVLMYFLIPFYIKFNELWHVPTPVPWHPALLSVHSAGTLSFFIWPALMLFTGRRLDCGYFCTCTSIREMCAYSFRDKTIKHWSVWRIFRHLKWLSFGYMVVFICCLPMPREWRLVQIIVMNKYISFPSLIGILYFGSLLLIPVTGTRNFCRVGCPFGAMYGIMNRFGLYRLRADASSCVNCRKCSVACDMGVPLHTLVQREKGRGKTRVLLNSTDCVGCGRCVTACPKDVLSLGGADRIALGVHRRVKLRNKELKFTDATK